MMSRVTTAVVCVGLAIAACSTAESDWYKATAANTLTAYQSFLVNHADDKRAPDARGRILAMLDDQAWASAQSANTVDGFQGYLQKEPGGIHAGDAKYQITALQRASAWQVIKGEGSAAPLRAFLQKYPQGPESNDARQKLSALAYRVQLANTRSKTSAERKRVQLQARFGTVLHDVVVVAPTVAGSDYRVTSEPMSQTDAKSACIALEREHQSCRLIQIEGTPG
jgi:hypothetical protein